MNWKKFLANKKILFWGGGLFLVLLIPSVYVLGKKISQPRNLEKENVIQLEDGRRMRLKEDVRLDVGKNLEERANLTGKIKTISGNEIIIEKFASLGERSGQGAGGGQINPNLNEEKKERPVPTIEGEVTVIIDSSTVLVKSPRGMRRPDKENTTEKIQQSELKEGDIISIWSSKQENSEKELALKIMLRTN